MEREDLPTDSQLDRWDVEEQELLLDVTWDGWFVGLGEDRHLWERAIEGLAQMAGYEDGVFMLLDLEDAGSFRHVRDMVQELRIMGAEAGLESALNSQIIWNLLLKGFATMVPDLGRLAYIKAHRERFIKTLQWMVAPAQVRSLGL